jgi:hypothetical protein
MSWRLNQREIILCEISGRFNGIGLQPKKLIRAAVAVYIAQSSIPQVRSEMDLIAESGRTLTRMLSFERKRVFTFQQGDQKNSRLLGQKGAALCELTQLGLPVPPGFVITTENFLEYVNHGEELRPELIKAVTNAIYGIEKETGRKFGKPSTDGLKLPLLLAVRAGTAVIIPG